MPEAHNEICIAAPVGHVYDVIWDFASYPQFLPEMRRVEILSQDEADVAEVRFDLELIMRVSYALAIRGQRPHSVRWTLQDAKLLTRNDGGWTLTPEGDKTHVAYRVDLEFRGLIPRSVSARLAGTTLPETLNRFRQRAEAAWAANKGLQPDDVVLR